MMVQRIPHSLQDIVSAEVRIMLKQGVIRKISSPRSSPIAMVKKKEKDGSWRFCGNFRKLNEVTFKDAYSLQ